LARDAIIQLGLEHEDLVPLIWQLSDPSSPGAESRFALFGGVEIPLGIFNGSASYEGEDNVLNEYTSLYDDFSGAETPWQLELDFGFNDENDYILSVVIELEEAVILDTLQVIFALTKHDFSNYSSLVLQSSFEDIISMSEQGESVILEKVFPGEGNYELTELRGVVLIQNLRTREVLQSEQTPITQLIPEIAVSMSSGPASLGIYFESLSFPQNTLEMWRWDFDNDGIIDSEEENPYFVYDNPGIYDVRLEISDGENLAERVFPEMITVEDSDNVQGTVTGIWRLQYSPYIIINDVSVPYYGELIIEPGTEVIVQYNKKINVYGRIEIAGNEEESVLLRSDDTWKGIKLLNSLEDNIIHYAEITNTNLSAVSASYSILDIRHSIFYGNTSGSQGAAIHLLGCDNVQIAGNRIYNNSSSMTGGIALRSSHPLIVNNIFANNQGSMAGALVIREGSDPVLINNVIANNTAPVAAIFVDESTPEFANNLLIDDVAVFLGDLESMRLSYNLSSQELPGTGNIMGDPLFTNPTPGSGLAHDALVADWHLQWGSPAIDAGDPAEEYNDPEDTSNPGMALYPALGTIRNDMGAFGGPGIIPESVPVIDEEIVTPDIMSMTAYPNPFNGRSNARNQLNFILSGESGGELIIYNLRGQKIKVLAVAQRSESVSWDGRNEQGKKVSSGIYFARWQKEAKSAYRKIIILE